jgi:uncharacterized C2H2 Zn-finger protein
VERINITYFVYLIAEGQIKPCCVKVERIKLATTEKSAEKPKIYKCYFCNTTRQAHSALYTHILQKHPNNTFFNCDYEACLHLYFNSMEEMTAHVMEQHNSSSDGPKLWRCVHCERVYIYRSKLRLHVRKVHQKVVLRCQNRNCGMILKSEADRQQHLEEKHNVGLKLKKCVYCERLFPSYRCLWSHLNNHHQHTMIKCNHVKCDTYFKSEADRQQHIEKEHQTRRNVKKCVYCNQWVSSIHRHMQLYHNNVLIKCNYKNRCGSFFKTEIDRDEHIKAVHLAGKQKLKVDCIFCEKSYPKGSSHVKFVHGDIAIKCSLRRCGQYFKNQEDCDKHFKEHHYKKEKLKTIFCPFCSYKTHNKTLFQQHSQNKHGKEDLKCAQCPASEKTYKSKQLLKQHISVSHVNPLDMQICPHCNISTSKRSLLFHLVSEQCSLCKVNYLCTGTMKEHKKWCKLKCEICLLEVTSETALLNHVNGVHNIRDVQKLKWLGDLRYLEKNVKCEKCDRCFYNLETLCRHVRMAHGEKTKLWTCYHCKKQLQSRFKMERHLRLIHGFIT